MIQGLRRNQAAVSSLHVEPTAPTDTPPRPGGKSGTAFALVLALLLPAGIFAQLVSPLAGLIWTEPFVFLLPAAVATAGSNLDSRAWLRLRPAAPSALALSSLVGLSGWFLGSALFAAVRALSPSSLVARYDLSRIFEGPIAERVAFTVTATVIAPLCEEVAFRGHLASAYHSRHRPAFAVAATAVVFALLHLDPLRAPSLLALGALYGWLAWRTGSIWPAVIAHAVNNGIASALALTMGRAAQRLEEPTLPDALVGVAVGAVAVAATASIFRAAVPGAPQPAPLPLADPSVASARFRLTAVPRQLLVVALAGWVSLAAILWGATSR